MRLRTSILGIVITLVIGLPLPGVASDLLVSPELYGQLRNETQTIAASALSVPIEDAGLVQLEFHPMQIWTQGARIRLYRDGEVTDTLEPPQQSVWVAGRVIGTGEAAQAVSAVLRSTDEGGLNLSVRYGDRELRWRSDEDTPRTLAEVEVTTDSELAELAARARGDSRDGEPDIPPPPERDPDDSGGVTDRIRFGHLGAEIAVVVDVDAAELIFRHGFEGGTNEPYSHVTAWVTDLFAHLNKPFRRDLQLSLTISDLDLHLGHGEPWDRWIPEWVRELPNLGEAYTPADRKKVGVALGALAHHWTRHKASVHRDAVLLLYYPGPGEEGDGAGLAHGIGGICDPSQAYAVAKVFPGLRFPTLRPDLSYNDTSYFIVAHELGHVFGGTHTYPRYDQCDGRRETSTAGISSIMSYCSARTNEFRESNRIAIRDVVERAQCLEMLPYPTLETLVPSVPVTGLAVSNGYSRRYALNIPATTEALELRTDGGQGTVMLYALRDGVEMARSAAAGTRQRILINEPLDGAWEVWVHGRPDFSNVTLEAHLVEKLLNGYARFGLSMQRRHGGTLSNYNSLIYALDVPASTTRLVVESNADALLGGGCGQTGDADLYLGYQGLSAPESSVTAGCSEERIVIEDPGPGLWYVALHAASDFQNVTLLAYSDIAIENGMPQSRTALSTRPIQTGDTFLYRASLPPDATELSLEADVNAIRIAQSASLIDVFARAGELPSSSEWDAVTTAWTHLNAASEVVNAPQPGHWYFKVEPRGQTIETLRLGITHNGGRGELTNRVPFGPLCDIGATAPQAYRIDVPAATDSLRFDLFGGTGNGDLYVTAGTAPGPAARRNPADPSHTWSAVSALAGNTEQVTLASPAVGDWHVLVSPTPGFCDATLTAMLSQRPYWDPDPTTMVSLYVPSNGRAGDVFPMAARAADGDGDSLTYSWDFGDGAVASETLNVGASEVDHVYLQDGSFVVSVTVDDGTGAPVITEQRTVLVAAAPPQPPVITQVLIPPTSTSGQPVTFEVMATDPAGLTLTYRWRFTHELGTVVNVIGERVIKVLPLNGRWFVELIVENTAGEQKTASGSTFVQ